MFRCKNFFFFLFIFCGIFSAKATHIVGGEMYYTCLGNNNYQVTLKLYRDCINGQAPFDDPVSIGVYTPAGVLVQAMTIPFPGAVLLPVTLNNPCFTPPSNVCVEEAVYTGTINLPPSPTGYVLAYQRCCRNTTILNLTNPLSVGFTITATIPPSSLALCNSSPRFDSLPPLFLCANVPFSFMHSATDPDGDSLVYELCDPYDGASNANPMPQPPAGPPFVNVPWNPPYNGNNPMSANPSLTINPVTGLLTCTPNLQGQWVVGICVKEYRNGNLLSVHMRDYQFNVTPCPNVTVISIPSQTTFCFGYTVQFLNASINASTYHWDFGVASMTNDTSNLFAPTFTYPDSGVYNVMLIGNPGTPCSDTAFTTFYIYPLLAPSIPPQAAQCISNNSFNFTAGGNFLGNGTFYWDFGPNASPQTSTQQNPSGITFNQPGLYTVTLTITENGCTQSTTQIVNVTPPPVVSFTLPSSSGCPALGVQFTDASVVGTGVTVTYFWDFGDGQTSTLQNPFHVYTVPGSYTVSLTIITHNGCVDTLTFIIPNAVTVFPVPQAGISATPTITTVFDPDITFTDVSQDASSCWINFGDGNSSNNCNVVHAYTTYGNYWAQQIVTNSYGCRDTAWILIVVKPEFRFWAPNAFTPTGDGKNDIFKPVVLGVENYTFMIFDRWGQLFFKTNDINEGWNGTYKGRPCQEDVYVWKVTGLNLVSGEEQTWIGHVSLIR
jgi:gliding motility-associated-like protein